MLWLRSRGGHRCDFERGLWTPTVPITSQLNRHLPLQQNSDSGSRHCGTEKRHWRNVRRGLNVRLFFLDMVFCEHILCILQVRNCLTDVFLKWKVESFLCFFMQKENRSFVFESDCQMRSLQGKTGHAHFTVLFVCQCSQKINTKSLNLPFQSREFAEELQPWTTAEGSGSALRQRHRYGIWTETFGLTELRQLSHVVLLHASVLNIYFLLLKSCKYMFYTSIKIEISLHLVNKCMLYLRKIYLRFAMDWSAACWQNSQILVYYWLLTVWSQMRRTSPLGRRRSTLQARAKHKGVMKVVGLGCPKKCSWRGCKWPICVLKHLKKWRRTVG